MHGIHIGARLGGEQVLIHLTQAGGVGAHFRGADAVGNIFPCGLQSLEHQLAGEIDIGAFLEHHGDDGQAGLGDGTHLGHLRQCIHHCLDGIGDQLLHFFRCQAFGFGVHLYLDVGHVREGIQFQVGQLPADHANGDDQ